MDPTHSPAHTQSLLFPVAAPGSSIGPDPALHDYFDTSAHPRLLHPAPQIRLYDAIARVHDHKFQVSPDMVDPSWSTPRPLILNPRECRSSFVKLRGNTDYMGIFPDSPGWRPRRSSYEDRRGAVGVTPSEVNTLVPYIPPIDTSLPPPSKEWLDAMAKRILADAQADLEDSRRKATVDATPAEPAPASPAPAGSGLFLTASSSPFEYDTDSSDDVRVPIRQPAPRAPPVKPESSSDETDPYAIDTDTDTDTSTDDEYDWNAARALVPPEASRWIIPRKRHSVIILNDKQVPMDVEKPNTTPTAGQNGPTPSDGKRPVKRRRRARLTTSKRAAKKPKKHANDTPTRRGGKTGGKSGGKSIPVVHNVSDSEEDCPVKRVSTLPPARTSSSRGVTTRSARPPVSSPSITATSLQINQVQIASPPIVAPLQIVPQPESAESVPPRSPKLFPCLLNGCTQVCTSAGDLQRHQQSLRHRAPSHGCLSCRKSYTRMDALKRHLNGKASCKKVHATRRATLAEGEEEEEVPTEANSEAV